MPKFSENRVECAIHIDRPRADHKHRMDFASRFLGGMCNIASLHDVHSRGATRARPMKRGGVCLKEGGPECRKCRCLCQTSRVQLAPNCEPLKAASAVPRFHENHMPPVSGSEDREYDLKQCNGLGKDRTSDRWSEPCSNIGIQLQRSRRGG
jgi:hypothetical protein